MKKIFISHKKDDSERATHIFQFLKGKSIECYLDVLDEGLAGDGEQLTRYLRSRLDECTHLLAVLSTRTKLSWWVPFEIGLATEKEFPISTCLYELNRNDIPSYLMNWPVIQSDFQLSKYADMVLRTSHQVLTESLNKSFAYNRPKNYAEAFHRELKNQLGQRP
ncbi:toll/interleukin-1 receptor domain-containing protein [Heyndrickxia oleronia]|uniref:toll/interleukin-1 receptor domain-containing protein n=1 Tax=Heyndrickxia oleronia TaxID=38875 RepID=UPI00204119BF|nr:toll/interleukin-1 receptor domain-containing protein [Heyndrickxia oleronia]